MYKILSSFIGVLILVGVAYALVPALFPDTGLFPRVPTGSGTIGGAIARLIGITENIENYAGTGFIANTLMLDGTTASGYLTANNCIGTDKWIGVDANNKPICGSTSTFIGDFGTIESQDCDSSTVYHASGSSTSPTSTGWTLKSGDILQTPVGCTVTITFSDLSILRLDGDTVVSFDIGYLSGGTSIASALLENGSLWGRILTETGSYSVGTHEIIAGVRGTSISLTSTGNAIGSIAWSGTGWTIPRTPSIYDTEVSIVDTTTSTGAVIACRKTDGGYRALTNLARSKSYMIPPGGCGGVIPSTISREKSDIFIRSSWARENTRKDLDYMYRKLALSGSVIPATKKNIITNEIDTTKPGESNTGVVTGSGVVVGVSLCNTGEVYWNVRYGCQPSSVLAIADYSLPMTTSPLSLPTLDIRNADGIIVPLQNNDYGLFEIRPRGIDLTLFVSKLQYNVHDITSDISGSTLTGKTIEIELVEPIDHTNNLLNPISQYFLDLNNDNTLKFQRGAGRYYSSHRPLLGIPIPNNSLYTANPLNVVGYFSRDTDMKIYTYTISDRPINKFVIGSKEDGSFKIQKKIKSIKIWN